MKTMLALLMTFGLFTMTACGPDAEEKRWMQAVQKMREDSLVNAALDSVRALFAIREQEIIDSLKAENVIDFLKTKDEQEEQASGFYNYEDMSKYLPTTNPWPASGGLQIPKLQENR